jgi:hypothetical protein
MLRFSKTKHVDEYEARGDIERVYHEIRQTLRVTGVNLNFRTWARYEKFFPLMWDVIQPNLETRPFENAADSVRAEAVRFAERLGRLDAASSVHLGESQAYQIQAALHLYHYINPKLLVLTSAVRLALNGEHTEQSSIEGVKIEFVERGIPGKMYPMEMVSDDPEDEYVRDLFNDIKQTLSLPSINSDYRTLALWPTYLQAAWKRLKPLVGRSEYMQASNALRERARVLSRSFPYPIRLSREYIEVLGEDADEIMKTTSTFEQLLPPLMINIALFELDWHTPDELIHSPFPAMPRRIPHHGEG